MARIPGAEGLGEQVARGPRLNETQIPAGAFGGGVARTVDAVAGAVQRDQAIEAQRKAVLDREAQQEREQAMRQRQAAMKAKAAADVLKAEEDLNGLAEDVSTGILNGQRDKTAVRDDWRTLVDRTVTDTLEGVPAELRGDVKASLELRAQRLTRGIGKALMKRDQDDTRGAVAQTLEHAQRLYATDPKRADELATTTLDQLGPFAGMGADDIGKAKQSFREGAQYTAAFDAVSKARGDYKGLQAAEKLIGGLPDLDPQKRAALLDRAAGYRMHIEQRAEIAAARQQRQAEAHMRKAEAIFTSATALADKGVLQQGYVDEVLAKTAGTPYAQAFGQLMQAQRQTGPLAAAPVATQRRALDELNSTIAKQGLTPELEKRRDQFEKVVRGTEADIARDPLRAALDRGVIEALPPLNLADANQLGPAIAARMEQWQTVSAWARGSGVAVSPLTQDEAQGVGDLLDMLPAKEKGGAVEGIRKAIGAQAAHALATQIDAKSKTLGLAMRAPDKRTAADIFAGETALKDGTAAKDAAKLSGWNAEVAKLVDGLALPNAKSSDAIKAAAGYVLASKAAANGGSAKRGDYQAAVEQVVGGKIVEQGDGHVVLPEGVTSNMLAQRLRSVTADEMRKQGAESWVRAGGAHIPLDDFVKALPGATLVTAAPGRYVVVVGGRIVTTNDGKALEIGL
jgi:hypothetical protein